MPHDFLDRFLVDHHLPADYRHTALQWFRPLASSISEFHDQHKQPVILAINGCQGSGKSTLAAVTRLFLERIFNKRCVTFSLDDFYLTKHERRTLASLIHPLLAVRGVPGTHDTALIRTCLEQLGRNESTAIPVFSKANDDRMPEEHWQWIDQPMDIVIFEGWCLGTPPQQDAELVEPINALEAEKDPEGIWRRYVNDRLRQDYLPLYQIFHAKAMLKAPNFDCVYAWRKEQEDKLKQKLTKDNRGAGIMNDAQLKTFMSYFERLTVHSLNVQPDDTHFLYSLDASRQIHELGYPLGPLL